MPNSDEIIVFYSWQSDLDTALTRSFIRRATERACKELTEDPEVADSPRTDQDTKGIAGTPAITQTIFRKIESSAVFVADVTIVCRHTAPGRDEKGFPNPNVMLELGYAAATIGWDRIVLVMNTLFGDAQLLPFDLRNRRFPIQFRVDRADDEQSAKRFSATLKQAITDCLAQSYQAANDVVERLDTACLALLKRHAQNGAFWEELRAGQDSLGQLYSVTHDALRRLLEMGVIRSFQYDNAHGFAYRWTYLGQQVLKQLGYTYAVSISTGSLELPPPVVIETFSQLDDAARIQVRIDGG